ncbi:MAG: alpha/beta fold hydrolase [Chloroflexi bacterium]|nr:alpha/beta fold hydrolase [Chloroflexota bacterium]
MAIERANSTHTEPSQFREKYVDADGFHIRYLEAGTGAPLVHFHGAGGLRLSRSHERLAQTHRVILFEVPGFGNSPTNERFESIEDLGRTMTEAITHLGIDRFNLMGNSFGGKLALWTALQVPERILSLVLVAPAAILPDNHVQDALTRRLSTPSRTELEARMASFQPAVLVVWGTDDRMIPSEMGRVYVEKLPTAFFVLLYDAGHEADADRPEAFADLVTEFIERGAGFVVNRRSGVVHP